VVAKILDTTRPIVRKADVHLSADLQEFANIQLTDVMDAMQVISIVWETFEMGFAIIIPFPDSRHGRNTERAELDDVGGAEIVDVRGGPSTVVQLIEVVARLVVPPTENGQIRGDALALVEFMKVSHGLVFGWDRDASRII
jgi:hypothetical protein